MKNNHTKLFAIVITLAFCFQNAVAQIEIPQPSPTATFSQKVGLTNVTITYSRPGVKGREIFGGLVPYGELWRTGANAATKFEFSDDVIIAGKELPAGTYSLFTIPGEDEWTVIFNKNWQQGGTGQYSEEEDAIRFTAKPIKTGTPVETFTIYIDNVRNASADIVLMWDETIVKFPIEVDVDSKVMADIEQNLKVQPGDYYQAAVYYHETGKDLEQAHDWITRAIEEYKAEGQNVFWVYRRKALIEADMGNYDKAIKTAETSKKQAQEAGNMQYVEFNEKSIAEWQKKK